VRLCFITATPLNVIQGSGTFVGIDLLARTLRTLGIEVDVLSPRLRFPIYTAQRLAFNATVRHRIAGPYDAIVGFDMDGYRIAGRGNGVHVACIKGVIADEMRFERGWTRATMGIQAACERVHVRRATRVITTSQYSADRINEFYAPARLPLIVPEMIDLESWERLSSQVDRRNTQGKFVVLSVCRFYRRKRLETLLAAAERIRDKIANLEVRIVGGGPEQGRLRRIWRDKCLEAVVVWREDISQAELGQEYANCDVFCLPTVQEGFGIVFLEAMAFGKPIVACRAGATPEVVQHGVLTRPDDVEELADAIERLCKNAELRGSLGRAGREAVKRFDAPAVAKEFLLQLQRMQASGGNPAPGRSS